MIIMIIISCPHPGEVMGVAAAVTKPADLGPYMCILYI